MSDAIIAALIGVFGVGAVQICLFMRWAGRSDERQEHVALSIKEIKEDLKGAVGKIAELAPQVDRFRKILDGLDQERLVLRLPSANGPRRRKPAPAEAA